jgi:hypothetical protein
VTLCSQSIGELCGNGVVIRWSNKRREHVVYRYGAEIGAAFRLPAARGIAHQHNVTAGYDRGYLPREHGL